MILGENGPTCLGGAGGRGQLKAWSSVQALVCPIKLFLLSKAARPNKKPLSQTGGGGRDPLGMMSRRTSGVRGMCYYHRNDQTFGFGEGCYLHSFGVFYMLPCKLESAIHYDVFVRLGCWGTQ